ncbi:MAG: SIS domain-containing protein [Candidatus Brocadiia bacterium]
MGKKATPDLFDVFRARLGGIETLLEDMDENAAEILFNMILDAGGIFVTGKGRSGYVANCFAMRLMQMGFDVYVPGEATCRRIGDQDLMIAISCSGSTTTTVEMTRISRESEAKVVAVTAVLNSRLAQLADHTVLVPVTEREVKERYRYVLGPYNNTLFEEAALLYFDALLYCMLSREGIPEGQLDERHTNLE